MKQYWTGYDPLYIFAAIYLVLNMTSEENQVTVIIVMLFIWIICAVIGLVSIRKSSENDDFRNELIVKLSTELENAKKIIDEKEKMISELTAQDDNSEQGFSQTMTMQ